MRIATVSGSLSVGSANAAALDIVRRYYSAQSIDVFSVDGLELIPMFRPELVDSPPQAVAGFRAALESADGVVIAAPEYAGGLAGGIKNALDWCVGSGSLYHKAAAVISAGTTGGAFAIEQLVRTLSWQGALPVATVGIAGPKSKQDETGAFVHAETIEHLHHLADAVVRARLASPELLLQLVQSVVSSYGIDAGRFGINDMR